MAIVVSDDVQEGSGVGKTADGWTETRVKIVTGLTGSDRQNVADAITAVIAITGDINALHPEISGLRITSFQGFPEGDTICRVHIVYAPIATVVQYPDGWDWPDPGTPGSEYEEVGATVETVPTIKDASGNLMTVSFGGQQQIVKVNKMVPKVVRIIRKIEPTSPKSKATAYVGTTSNSGRWLCTSIMGTKNRVTEEHPTEKWNVTYSFEWRAETWNHIGYFLDETGKPMPGISSGNGIGSFQIYSEQGSPI